MEDKIKKFTKLGAIEYLVENSVYNDEWSGAGMYEQVERIIKSPKKFFLEKDLKNMLNNADNF